MISTFKARLVLDDLCRELGEDSRKARFLRHFADEMQNIDEAIADKRRELEGLHQEVGAAHRELEGLHGELKKLKGVVSEERQARSDWKPEQRKAL
jgi:predicted  nucleic acid-binding Zn-ribbon protein